MTAPPLSPAEQATVDRFEAACDVCWNEREVEYLIMRPTVGLHPHRWTRMACFACSAVIP